MPFRPLTDDELRQAARETLTHGDWYGIRDVVVRLFPNATEFGYYFSSEYNDEGYDVRQKLDCVFGTFDGKTLQLVDSGSLTEAGIRAIQLTPDWLDYRTRHLRYDPDPESFLYDELYEALENGFMLYLSDGEESDVIMADVKTGPVRKFNQLFVAVSE